MIWTISPVPVASFVFTAISLPLQRFGARSDLQHLFGDARLTCFVRREDQVADKVIRRVGRVAHRDHLRGPLRGLRLEDRLKDRQLDESREDVVHHPLWYVYYRVGERG